MLVHSVYFWLRDDLDAAQRERFEQGIRSLCAIETVARSYVGAPAATDRPIIERGYTRALILVFADQRAHDDYQVHPVHDRFRAECGALWTQVRIFDVEGDGEVP